MQARQVDTQRDSMELKATAKHVGRCCYAITGRVPRMQEEEGQMRPDTSRAGDLRLEIDIACMLPPQAEAKKSPVTMSRKHLID